MEVLDINIEILPFIVEVSNSLPDYETYNYMPTSFFRKDSSYDNERELYSVLQMEAYNIYGNKIDYFVVTFDTTYNKIWGEDNDRAIVSAFNVMSYYELPREDVLVSNFGLEGIDTFHVYINKMHFNKIVGGTGQYPININDYKPKVGDIIRPEYNNFYYEIVNVNHTEEMFLQYKHCWDLIVKSWKNEHFDYKV